MSCLECIGDVVVNDFVRLLGCSFPFNALPVPMLRQVYVFTFLVTFLVHCFRWSSQPPFGVSLECSGSPLGSLLMPLGGIWSDFGVFWVVSGS